MKKRFIKEFQTLLPDSISETSINLDDIESTTLLFIGSTISRMSQINQDYFDSIDSGMLDDQLINIVADKYQIEW